ncbi:PorP/SprF family type IX secretion system membrane protein [Flavobacterium cellulosilyticum]|uniref:Type IX secretion system membrane protein PorP/SprF n=1 Tax=Flavobacterium cellulosilyticum TaxID=2541731 RepID=A0A4R5CKG4_9FLAO|nr:type IX secretion system membrane protein PorP/SprF [Flavobacterium cellulosilyticum]TDD99676.1 type IX secretion system membrane protein PorP/SprF [Flavobacterium cellulosilyticum]
MKNIIISFLLLTVTFSYGQELNIPVATQYLADNPFVISPTFAGIGDNLRIRANGMKQWVGIKDSPENQSVYADFRIADQSGVGVSFYNDKNGYTSQSGAKFSFAHHIILNYYTKQYLSFGLSFNVNNFKIDISQLVPNTYDPSITDDRFTSNKNFDVGLLYRNKEFYFSFNAGNILDKNLDKFSGIKLEPRLLRNYQIYSGYVIKTQNWSELEPSVFFQYFESDGRSSTDLNIKYRKYNNNNDYYWGGMTYRFLNDQILKPLALGPMFGFKKSGFYFGYSYQITLNQLAAFNSGTHVVTIGFDFLANISNCPCTQSPVHD